MAKSKRYTETIGKVEKMRLYDLEEAFETVKSAATAKFDETVECHMKLGVDPKHAD